MEEFGAGHDEDIVGSCLYAGVGLPENGIAVGEEGVEFDAAEAATEAGGQQDDTAFSVILLAWLL